MNVQSLRTELKARNINSKGLKSQLVARLSKALKTESEKPDEDTQESDLNESKVEEESKDIKKEGEERKLDEKEKQLLEKKYTLPEEQHVIVHPSRVAKSGKFDCTVMSLSLLLDYRPEDTKEHSFEVSLFAELFNEMLMRDFGFNIYKSIHMQPEKVEEKKDERKKKDEKDKDKNSDKDSKSDKKSEDGHDEEEDDKRDKEKRKSSERDKDKDRKKEKRPKLITKDKNLLLSFVYFDTTHCGYIFEKDIEELIYTLGLSLSRAQVRKLVAKVITRDSLHYRKLTDGPKDEDKEKKEEEEKTEVVIDVEELAFGNKRLLPIFKNETNVDNKLDTKNKDSSDTKMSKGIFSFYLLQLIKKLFL